MGKTAPGTHMNDTAGEWAGRVISSIPVSYTIFKDAVDGVYRAEYNGRDGDDFESTDLTDSGVVINNARDALNDGDSILLRSGVYNCTTPIHSHKIVHIIGESMGKENDFASGTVINYTGGATDAIIDMREYTANLQNLKVHNIGSATRGVYVGATTNIVGKGKALDWRNVYIDGAAFGIQGDVFGPDDSCFTNCFITGSTAAVDHLSSGIKFFGGTLFSSPTGVRMRRMTTEDTGMQFYGTVWSNCSKAFDLAGTVDGVYGASLYGCWIEGCDMILDIQGLTAGLNAGHWNFDNCTMTIAAAPNTTFMDLRDRNVWVKIEGGTFYHVGETAGYILTDGASGTKQVIRADVYIGRETLHFTDANSGLRGISSAAFSLLEDSGTGYQPAAPLGAAYTGSGIQDHKVPWHPYNIVKATAVYVWNPKSASGKIRLFYGAGFGAAEPAAGDAVRIDAIDCSDYVRHSTGNMGSIAVQAADNNVTAPIFYSVQLVYEW